MDSLTTSIIRCNLQLKLDNATEGYGNCFPNAIIQQCRRKEILSWLQKNNKDAIFYSQECVRRKVTNFALKSQHRMVTDLKRKYEMEIQQVEKISWNEYWIQMAKDGTWVDHMFIQVTAWYTGLDILILTTSSLPESPFIFICGNIDNIQDNFRGPPMLLGNYTNVHYQSIIPNQMASKPGIDQTSEISDKKEEEGKSNDFTYIQMEMKICFRTIEGKFECPFCKNLFTRIVTHIKCNNCKIHEKNIEMNEFKAQIDSFKKGYRLESGRNRVKRCREKLASEKDSSQIKKAQNDQKSKSRQKLRIEKDPQLMKKQQNDWKTKSRDKLIAEKGLLVAKKKQDEWRTKSRNKIIIERGPAVIKKGQNDRKTKSRNKLIVEKGPVLIKKEQTEWKSKSREKLLEKKGCIQIKKENNAWKLQSRKRKFRNDPHQLLEDERKRKEKSRIVDSERKRLKKFIERTMYNAIFTCSCCQRNLFDSNVIKFDDKLKSQIELKQPGLVKKSIEYYVEININGKGAFYICHACKSHLKRGKLPPMSAKNGLKMHPQDPELELTDLEGSLISRSIVFMKIFQLPKSRWTALRDKIVNVPINEDDIINTITRLPRTPQEAGMIEVDLKRKVEYQNSHQKQLINPDKCFKMLEVLKKHGNPHYQFYDDYNTYSNRCKETDKKGFSFIFDEDIDPIIDISDKNAKRPVEIEEICIEEILETDYLKNDPVRKYQFDDYNKSLCMSNMFPEAQPGNSVIVAPGEGKTPRNVLHDDDWDIKAFPHLNSPDGKFGLQFGRETKLSSQYYFIQRICNQNPKFARSPSYVYAAVGHTELTQIQRNINVSYSRGKESAINDGVKTLKLEDPYAVLDDIKQTPRYWRKSKYEMFAKLDNFGPFHFFFTLSCADLRWDENFAAILRTKGCTISYEMEEDQDGFPRSAIYVKHEKDGKLEVDPLDKYINEQINESLHECIRGNVLLATRYFNHRVKAFINNIIMGGGNPMMVDKLFSLG